MEDMMRKGLVTMTAALSFLSVGSLVSAYAGGATSAASKYDNSAQAANAQARNQRAVQTAEFSITEFSSSSAHSSAPKR